MPRLPEQGGHFARSGSMWRAIAACALAVACASEPEEPVGGDPVRPSAPAPAGPDYAKIRSRLETKRQELAREHRRDAKRALRRGREVLVAALRDEILPAWNGTPWAMNGTSQVPQQGKIACGYFVSTTLLHAGFQLERARLGQQASEHITRSLVTSEPIWRSSDWTIERFITRLRRDGNGIYLVGLDSHVGFVIVDGANTWFHHSGPNNGVDREPALTASFLSTSRYREAAKLFDDELVEKWLRATPIETVLPRPRTR
jgi:hypothetical protein